MSQSSRVLRIRATLVSLLAPPIFSRAGTRVPFGLATHTGGTGAPVTMTDTFTLLTSNKLRRPVIWERKRGV